MKTYSVDKFELRSRMTPDEIFDRLNNRTLKKKILGMYMTEKDFIGRVNQESFSVIDSSFPLPYGAACILNGTISPTSTIALTTTLHKAFRILYLVWLIVITVMFFTFWVIDSARLDGFLAFIIGMPIMAFLFRLFLHGMYVLARNHGLMRIKRVLEVTN